MQKRILLSVLMIGFCLHLGPVTGWGKGKPINITSDRLEAYNAKGFVIFSGNVVVTQDDTVTKAQKLYVYYKNRKSKEGGSETGIAGSGEVEKIEARENVTITQGAKIITGDAALFDNAEQKIVVTGNVVLREGDNVITGERAVFYMAENRGVVDSAANGRVSATIYSERE